MSNPFISISLRTMTLCIYRFSSARHSETASRYKHKKILKVLLRSCPRTVHHDEIVCEPCHFGDALGEQQLDSDGMPAFLQHSRLVTSNTCHTDQAEKVRFMFINISCPWGNVIMVTTVTTNKQFWVLLAASRFAEPS